MTATCSTDPTWNIVQTTSKYLAPKHKSVVQQQILVCDTVTHLTHVVGLLQTVLTVRNLHGGEPLPSVADITVIIELDTH